jgi:hypothetical protein
MLLDAGSLKSTMMQLTALNYGQKTMFEWSRFMQVSHGF